MIQGRDLGGVCMGAGGGGGGGGGGVCNPPPPPPPPPEVTCSFLIELVFSEKNNFVAYWC